jgi:putative oxidoreductase
VDVAIILLRLVAGLTLAAHGSQKLFGSFGGSGIAGTQTFFASLGFRTPRLMAFAAGTGELAGGLLLASGLLTPVAALALVVVMLNAIATVHWRKGFFNSAGGYEYNLLVIATALAVTGGGPGRFSLDAAFGWSQHISGPWWMLAVVGPALVSAGATLTVGRGRNKPVTRHSSVTGKA